MGALPVELLLGQCALLLFILQRLLVFFAPCALCWFARHGDFNVAQFSNVKQLGDKSRCRC